MQPSKPPKPLAGHRSSLGNRVCPLLSMLAHRQLVCACRTSYPRVHGHHPWCREQTFARPNAHQLSDSTNVRDAWHWCRFSSCFSCKTPCEAAGQTQSDHGRFGAQRQAHASLNTIQSGLPSPQGLQISSACSNCAPPWPTTSARVLDYALTYSLQTPGPIVKQPIAPVSLEIVDRDDVPSYGT